MGGAGTREEWMARAEAEFLARFRAGERPGAEEFSARYPELGSELRERLEVLAVRELFAGGAAGDRDRTAAGGEEPSKIGPYRLTRELGQGGMGRVYEASHVETGKRVALKILFNARDAKQFERFDGEIETARSLRHPGIAGLEESGRDARGRPYYTMTLVEGRSLDQLIQELRRLRFQERRRSQTRPDRDGADPGTRTMGLRQMLEGDSGEFADADADAEGEAETSASASANGRPRGDDWNGVSELALRLWNGALISEGGAAGCRFDDSLEGDARRADRYFRSVAWTMAGMCEAMAHAHGRGIVHRDIKPSNLILDHAGKLWITDFGLAKALRDTRLTQTGDIVGTLRYMAPERFSNVFDARSDIYGIGVTLYELTTLHTVHDSVDQKRLIQWVMEEEPPRPRQLDARIPKDLETVILKAMAKSPRDRYGTAEELRRDLLRFAGGEPVRARRPSAWRRMLSWAERNPLKAGLSLATAATVAVSAAAVCLSLMAAVAESREKSRINAELERSLARSESLRAELAGALTKSQELRAEADRSREEAEARYREANRNLYLGRINQANLSLAMNNSSETIRTLSEAARGVEKTPGERGWEWGYLWNQSRMQLAALSPPIDGATPMALAFSPDRRFLAAGFGSHFLSGQGSVEPGGIAVWNAGRWSERARVRRASGSVVGLAFSPDGTRLAALSRRVAGMENPRFPDYGQDTIEIHDMASWTLLSAWNVPRGLADRFGRTPLAFSEDGSRLIRISPGGGLEFRDAETGKPLGTREFPGRKATMFARLGNTGLYAMVSAKPNEVFVWDEATDEVRMLDRLGGLASSLTSSGDGSLLSVTSESSQATVYDVATGLPRFSVSAHPGGARGSAFLPRGDRLVTVGDDRTLRVWDAEEGGSLGVLRGHTAMAVSVAVSPDGRFVVTGGDYERLLVWDAWSYPNARVIPAGGAEKRAALEFLDGGRVIASSSLDHAYEEWDVATGRRRAWNLPPGGHGMYEWNRVGLAPRSGTLLTFLSEGEDPLLARVWDGRTGELKREFSTHGHPLAVAIRPDGREAAILEFERLDPSNPTRRFQVWRRNLEAPDGPGNRRLFSNFGLGGELNYTPDGEALLVPSRRRTERGWKLWLELLGPDDSRLWESRMPPDSRSRDDDLGDDEFALVARFDPAGRLLGIGTELGRVLLVDRASGKVLGEFRESEPTQDLDFHPEGGRLAVVTRSLIRIWRFDEEEARAAANGAGGPMRVNPCLTIPLPRKYAGDYGYRPRVRFDPTGEWLAATNQAGNVLLWRGMTRKRIAETLTPPPLDRFKYNFGASDSVPGY